jgi:AcrR family transcriptional regulator
MFSMQGDTRDTRQRLLDAAEMLFAERGFDAVSVRDISETAAVNVAAVNYHFHGKEYLYREVLNRVMTAKRDRYVTALRTVRSTGAHDLEVLLQVFFRTHFEDTLKNDHGASFIKLLVREVHHGDIERRQQIHALLAPLWSELQHSLRTILPELDEALSAWIVGSLHGQLIHFTMRWHHHPQTDADQSDGGFLQSLMPPLAVDADRYIDAATDYLTRFCAAGIRCLVANGPAATHPPRKDRS